MAIAGDVHGFRCETLYVHIVMEVCRGETTEEEAPEPDFRTQDREQTGWEDLDEVCLRRVFERRFRVLHGCPVFLKERFRHAVRVALEKRQSAVVVGDTTGEVRVWKLFLLLPVMLLRCPVGDRRVGKEELTFFWQVSGTSSWKVSGQWSARKHRCQDSPLQR